ncbi:ABC transporter substrate-binding protein [Marinobacter salicampi]|uniref:ABC transporter substrate-binding protein n=1 Tax=Marinobacter salicampi TaxID=435907 RepID=UPI00140AC1B5|nr:ABC transporter substrate-binding protein [Marinobacter salicampi]
MIKGGLVGTLLAGFLVSLAFAEQAPQRQVSIGYVQLEDDPRYLADNAYTGIEFRELGRPLPGARVGLKDAETIGQVTSTEFSLKPASADSVDELIDRVRSWHRNGNIHFIIADLPAEQLLELAAATRELPVLYFNVSASDDRLRGSQCQANIAHVYPSDSMLTDALMQYLVSQKWTKLLVLKGEEQADERLVRALDESARKFGAEFVAERSFTLGKNPRNREQNNIALLTGEARYDVVFVADTSGELGRYVPYQTQRPRPVVGTAGLSPLAWHWSWHRHGAPQLQHRFEELASPRRMNSASWAAWASVKAVVQAAMRAESHDFEAMRAFILGGELNLDGSKGSPSSFRAWDQQLRQPLLLATPNAVIARLPLRDFMHAREVLDTLGTDEPESECQL